LQAKVGEVRLYRRLERSLVGRVSLPDYAGHIAWVSRLAEAALIILCLSQRHIETTRRKTANKFALDFTSHFDTACSKAVSLNLRQIFIGREG
jgi:hypothetical protein